MAIIEVQGKLAAVRRRCLPYTFATELYSYFIDSYLTLLTVDGYKTAWYHRESYRCINTNAEYV